MPIFGESEKTSLCNYIILQINAIKQLFGGFFADFIPLFGKSRSFLQIAQLCQHFDFCWLPSNQLSNQKLIGVIFGLSSFNYDELQVSLS